MEDINIVEILSVIQIPVGLLLGVIVAFIILDPMDSKFRKDKDGKKK